MPFSGREPMLMSRSAARVRRLTALVLVPLMIVSLLPVGCSQSGASVSREIVPDLNEGPAVAAARLAKALKGAKTLDEARPAVREILARAGITVRAKGGAVVAHPTSPTVDVRYFEFQADNLSLDHIERQGFTMAQLAQCLAESPAEGAAYWQDPVVLRRFLRGMVEAAKAQPNAPQSFGPLVLEELVRSRETSSSLLDESLDPSAFPMTYLEMLMFCTSVVRGLGPRSTSALPAAGGSGEVAMTDPVPVRVDPLASALLLAPTPAYALSSNPCEWLGDMVGKDVKDIRQGSGAAAMDTALEDIAETAAEGMSDFAGTATKWTTASVGWITALISLVLTQGGFSIVIEPQPAVGHYYWSKPEHGDLKTKFVARVSSRPVTDKDLQACLEWIGVELPDEKSAEDATVHWVPLYGIKGSPGTEHGEVSTDGLDTSSGAGGGRLEQRVKDGKATLTIVMKSEKNAEAQKTGKIKKDRMDVQAELYTQNPGGGKLLGMLFGGVTDAAKVWADRWFPKRAIGTMPVQWHALPKWRGEWITKGGGQWIFESTEGEGLHSIWTATFQGGGPDVEGHGKFDLANRDVTDLILKASVGDTINLQMAGEVQVAGTDENPVLVLTGNLVDLSAQAPGVVIKYTEKGPEIQVKLEPVE